MRFTIRWATRTTTRSKSPFATPRTAANFSPGYTYSKAMDNGSGLGDQVYPFNYKVSKALSAFDTTNNFVVSYTYTLPFDRWPGGVGSPADGGFRE